MKNSVEYNADDILDILKKLEQLVVSLNKIAMASADDSSIIFEKEIVQFMQDYDVLNNLAVVRMVLSTPFDSWPRMGDRGFLEDFFENVEYWNKKN